MYPLDRKQKCYENAVDVVERLHDPTDPSTGRTAPPSSAHIQLDDVPRTPIQPSVEGEFRQHDSMVTMMIKEQGGRCGRPRGGAPGGVLLLPGVGLPPFSLSD